jgi:hypothetical protein
MGKKNLGSSFDDFLEDEGLLEEVTARPGTVDLAFRASLSMPIPLYGR